MVYSLKRILNYIKQNAVINIMFAVALVVGLGVLFSCSTVLQKANNDITQAKKIFANQVIRVEYCHTILSEPTQEDPYPVSISAERYNELMQAFSENIDIGFAPYVTWYANYENEEFLMHQPVFFMNDIQFEMLFGQKMQRGVIYATGKNYSSIETVIKTKQSSIDYDLQDQYNTLISLLKTKNGELQLLEKEKLTLMQTPSSKYTKIPNPNPGSTQWDFLIEDIMIVAYDYYPEIEKYITSRIDKYRNLSKDLVKGAEPSMPYCILNLKLKNENQNIDILPMVTSFLNDNASNIVFEMDIAGESMQNTLEDMQAKLLQYQAVAVAMLAIVVCSCFGIVLVNLQKRKKTFAVAMAYGATKKRIMLEVFLELFLVNTVAGILAVWVTKKATPFLQELYVGVQVDVAECLVLAIIFAFVSALFPTIIAFGNMGEIAPYKILKENK